MFSRKMLLFLLLVMPRSDPLSFSGPPGRALILDPGVHVLTGIPFHLKLLMYLLIMFSNVIYRVIVSDNLIIVTPYSFAHVLICLIVIYLWVHFYISNTANCVSYA